LVIYAATVDSIFDNEKLLLEIWIRRLTFLMFMISTHNRLKLIDKRLDLWPAAFAAQIHEAAADALTEAAIQRSLARASLWRWQKDEIRNEICPYPTSCGKGGGGCECGREGGGGCECEGGKCEGGCVTNSIMTSSSRITSGSSSNDSSSSSSSGVVFENSIRHQDNIKEVFTEISPCPTACSGRAFPREALLRWQKNKIRNKISPCPTSCSCGGGGCECGGGECDTNSITTNSISHQNNIDEVFTRWTIFVNITSFL